MTKTKKNTHNSTPLETFEQVAFVEHMESKGIRFFAVPNGCKKTKYQRWQFQREGLRSGVPDLFILEKSPKGHSFLALEMKRQKGGSLSQSQKGWIDWLDKNDYAVAVACGCQSAIRILDNYLKGDY
jgi:hypothetical protein